MKDNKKNLYIFNKKYLIIYTMLFMFLANSLTVQVNAAKYEKDNGVQEEYLQTDAKVPKLYSEAAIIMDAKTGEILFQKNAKKKEYPASITKCMTSLVAIENNDLRDEITYSSNAIFDVEEGSSGVALDVGEVLTVEQSLYGAMLESANECCNGLAEKTSGSVDAFVELMNQKAKEIGCEGTHFVNANGLYNKQHYTTAYDMALIVKEALKNDEWRKFCGTLIYEVPPTNKMDEKRYWRNHHSFVNKDIPYASELFTAEGGKTGYTVKAKNTLVTYAKSNVSDMELICVVMRCQDYFYFNGRSFSRVYTDTNNLLEYGFSNFTTISSSVDFASQIEDEDKDYMMRAYEMLQPDKFITFTAENDCQIAVSNTYDISKLHGTLSFDKEDNTGKWGTYEFTSGGNVISSTDVYYSMNQDVLKDFYRSSNRSNNIFKIRYIIFYVLLAMIFLLVILGTVKIIKTYSIMSVFGKKSLGSLDGKNKRISFKPRKKNIKNKRERGSHDFAGINRRRRRRRYTSKTKNKKLHF